MTTSHHTVAHRKARPATTSRQPDPAVVAPSVEEARARLKAVRGRLQLWLTLEAFEAAKGVPEVIGPGTYRKP